MNFRQLSRLTDSQETASIKEARKLLVEKANMTDEQADKWVRGDLRAAFPILRDKKAAKFILGTTRLLVEQQLNDADAQNKLTRVLKEINEAHYDEFDRNLNGKSLQDLYSPFEQTFKEADKATREASSSKQFGKSDYIIHGPYDSFEQAEEEWGNNSQDWCVFHRQNMYDSYTSAGQRFYVAAQNGWKHIRRVAGEDAPKDTYGNSLIAISVDIEGNLATSTPRWNHENGGGDNTYTVDELEDILQMPFYETFEPYTKEERRARGIVSFAEAAERLASGEDPHDIFSVVGNFYEGSACVKLNNRYNFIDTHNNLLFDQWFDSVGDFQEGFAAVKLNGKWNLLDIHNNLLSDQWFDNVGDFQEGFAAVKLNGKWNFVDTHNNLLFDQWFDSVGNFQEGFASVKLNNRYNFINTHNNLLTDQWFDYVDCFYNGFAVVKSDGKWNFIDTNGNFLSSQWFDNVGDFHEGFARVMLNVKWNLLDIHNNLLSDRWFDSVGDFQEGFATVKLNGKWNFIDTNGDFLSDRWFDRATAFNGGFADVFLNGRWHYINTGGRIVDSKRTSNLNCKKLLKLSDSQETASIKEARKLLVEKAGMTDEQADKWVRGDLRAAFPILRDKKAAKFILGVARLFVEQQLNDADAQNKLTRVLKEINEAHYDEFDRNLNGKSLSELYSPLESKFKEADKATREASSSKQFGKSDYIIHGPYDSFEQAEEEWGNNSQDWCVFHRQNMYDSYTSAGQRFYVAAHNGWESVPNKVGDNAPKDAYGNSLIAISVDIEGNLATSTPRWNHAHGGGDNTYTVDELEDILQMPFYETFKPYTDDERRARGIVSFAEAAERLASGEDPHDIFSVVGNFHEGFAPVQLNNRCNFIDTHNNLLSDQWFDSAGYFHEGFARVNLNGKHNFIDTQGNLLSDQWFDSAVGDFHEGFAVVESDSRWNFINTEGNLLSDQWFDYVDNFQKGFAVVKLNGKWNFINTEGNLLSDRWFDGAGAFYKGFADVNLNGRWNFINTEGNLLSDQWFDYSGHFNEGFVAVELNNKYNFIDTEGNLLSDQWFDYAGDFYEGFAHVNLNGKHNFIDTQGNLLSDQWFDYVDNFQKGFAAVKLNRKWNFINTEGNLLSDQWFDYASGFYSGFSHVELNRKRNFIDTKGNFLSSQWFDSACNFHEGFADVKLDGKYNFIDTEGNLLSDQWFDSAGYFHEGFADVKSDGRWHRINTEGRIVDSKITSNLNCKKLLKLSDSQETASIKEARKLLVEKAGMTDEQADKWVRGDLRAAFPILRDKKAAKFILGTTRLFVEQQLNDADSQNKLTRVLKEINEAHYDEFDRNLNGKSLSELYSPLESKFKEADKATREASSSKQFGKSDYKIYGPYDSFEQAKKAWGNNSQTWCVFHDEDAFNNYTSAGQRFYVAAHNGWESVPREAGVNAPKDAYGNSLIASSVDADGNLATSTPRWNHANGGGDNTYTVDELEDILQMPFYETFEPYTEEERRARGIVSFKEAAERLASGEDPHDIFSVVGHFHEGFARVNLNGKHNFIDTQGNLLSDQWFDSAGYFHEGFARVNLNGKHNFIDTKGNLLSDQWFDRATAFNGGFADVFLNGRWHYINTSGRIVDSKITSNLNCKKLLKLSDSQETASIKEARKLLVEKANMTDEQADKWVRGDLRAAFPILRDKKAAKFILGVARLFVEQQLNDADAQNKLTRVLKEINEAHYDEFDRNLNGKSLSELYSPLESKFKEADKATREASSSKQFGKSDYKIYGPYDSFEQAKKAWGNRSQDWCVFHRKDMYVNYTSAGQRFYVAAQNGWESVPREVGVNAPKDAYGNSLIAISVDIEGNLATSTPRWNHANGGGDNTYTLDELEDILQMPFYDTFKPYTDDERRARGIVSFAEAAERLASGEDPHDIFSVVGNFYEGSACVKLNNRYNFIDTHNNLLFDQWFDYVDNFQKGFAAVKLNGKWNFINTEGNLLSDQWFDYAGDFHEGFAVVESDSKWNFINTEGNLLSDQWFDRAGDFQEGFAAVELNGKWNFINTEGNLLSDQWFDYAGDFHEGFAVVESDSRWNFINTEGNLLSDQWFDYSGHFNEGFVAVELNDKWNFIDTNGNFLSSQWFDNVGDFHEGFARVILNGKRNFVDVKGNFLSSQWFDNALDFHEGFARVTLNDKRNFIDTKGNFLSDQWFDNAYYFHEGFADVKSDGRWHRINTEGRIVDSKRTSNLNCKKLLKLSDSQETASIKEARKLLVEKAGMTDEQADKWVRGDLRATFPILRDKKAAKFILGTTRLFVEQQLNDADSQNKLTRVLKEINEAHYDEFDRNLNGKSLSELYSPLESKFKEADKATREASSGKSFGKSDYKIYGPYDSFEQAEEEWGNNSQDWCVFHDEDAFNNYTSAGQRFYVAAQNGWESVPREVGVNAPKDAYGNSLIAISVDIEGNLATSTPRWNHANGGGDNTYTVDELEDILQMPFYETFKPYTEEERRERGIMSFKEAAERLASGEDPHDIFSVVGNFYEGSACVKLNNRYNFIDTHNNLLSDQWFDSAGYFHEGFARVNLNGKHNFIDTQGNLLSDQWFDSAVGDFYEGSACVKLNNRYNFIDTQGNLLSDQWFDVAMSFREGFAAVKLNGKWNFINTEGNLLSDQWFDSVGDFQEGFAAVKLNNRYNFINTHNNLLTDQWFDYVDCFYNGFAVVKSDGKWNFIDTNGNFLSSQWFDNVGDFHEGFAVVKSDGKWNFIDTNGNFLSSQWFDNALDFHEGFATVKLNGKWNFIDTEGNLLSDQWFDRATAFNGGFADVNLNGRWHRINTEGRIVDSKITSNLNCKKLLKLSDSQETVSIKKAAKRLALGEDPHDIFDYVYAVHEGFSCVQLRDKYNFIDTNGNFLSSQWFDYAGDFYEGFATVKLNGKWNYIDTEGNFLLDQWFDVAYSFHDGFACVWLKSKWNFIDTKGNFLSDRWFDDSIDFRDGVVRVKLDSGWHLIDKYGTILDSKRTYNLNCKKLLKHIK